MNRRHQFGKVGEQMAVDYLKKKGYRILHTNWSCRWGEIDIVASHKKRVVFVEVKTRKWRVLETMSPEKQKHLLRTVQLYMHRYGILYEQIQIDFIGVEWGRRSTPTLIHIPYAIEARR